MPALSFHFFMVFSSFCRSRSSHRVVSGGLVDGVLLGSRPSPLLAPPRASWACAGPTCLAWPHGGHAPCSFPFSGSMWLPTYHARPQTLVYSSSRPTSQRPFPCKPQTSLRHRVTSQRNGWTCRPFIDSQFLRVLAVASNIFEHTCKRYDFILQIPSPEPAFDDFMYRPGPDLICPP